VPQYIDYDGLKKHFANQDSIIKVVLNLFIEQAPVWINDLTTAFHNRDVSEIKKICHKIRGGALTVQALTVCEALDVFIEFAENDTLNEAQPSFEYLVSAIHQTHLFVLNSANVD